jgi:hypothetical protein
MSIRAHIFALCTYFHSRPVAVAVERAEENLDYVEQLAE